MLLVCSAATASASGPNVPATTLVGKSSLLAPPVEVIFGFWVQQYFGPSVEGFLGSTSSTTQVGSSTSGPYRPSPYGISPTGQWARTDIVRQSQGQPGTIRMPEDSLVEQPSAWQQLLGIETTSRPSCLEERYGPCVRSEDGVWVAAHPRPGRAEVTELSILVRTDSGSGVVDLSHSMELDSAVLDIVEESGGASIWPTYELGAGSASAMQRRVDKDQPLPIGTRSFALLCESGVQVLLLTLKAASSTHDPRTEHECYLHLVKLAQPQPASNVAPTSETARAYTTQALSRQPLWSFADARLPTAEEQKANPRAPLYLGKWHGGFVRFLAHTLRPIWHSVLVAPVQDLQYEKVGPAECQEVARRRTMGLCLSVSEAQVQRLLMQLRPLLAVAQKSLASTPRSQPQVSSKAHERAAMYTRTVKVESEVQAQAVACTQEVLGVAQRAQEVLSLLAVLHAQKSAFRVLQSTVLEQPSREKLLLTPFGTLIATPESLSPIVKLCMALVAESGLLTPAAELTFRSRQGSDWQGVAHATSSSCKDFDPWQASTNQQFDPWKGTDQHDPRKGSNEEMPNQQPGPWRASLAAASMGLSTQEFATDVAASRAGFNNGSLGFSNQQLQPWNATSIDLCRDLEEVCPAIFSKVDLDARVRGSLSSRGNLGMLSPPDPPAGEVLGRVLQCTSSTSEQERWDSVASGIRELAAQDPESAAKICVEKVLQVQQVYLGQLEGGMSSADSMDASVAMDRSARVIEALVAALDPLPTSLASGGTTSKVVVEMVLMETIGVHFDRDRAMGKVHPVEMERQVPFTHRVLLQQLLNDSRFDHLFEALLESRAVNLDSFLTERSKADRRAAEFLWKLHLRNNRPLQAAKVLRDMAEQVSWEAGAASEDTLQDRLQHLDKARQAAGLAGGQWGEAMLHELGELANAGNRVQTPLLHEVALIAADERLSIRWRNHAHSVRLKLEHLQPLATLQQLALEFGLFHIALLANSTSPVTSDKEAYVGTWVKLFFGTVDVPYSFAQLEMRLNHPQLGLFPLLFVRLGVPFLLHGSVSHSQHIEKPVPAAEDFSNRAMNLLESLALTSKGVSPIWDVRYLAPLLEYGACMWMRAVAEIRSGSGSQAEPSSSSSPHALYSWVVLQVLPQRPFNFGEAAILRLYGEIFMNMALWMTDLESLLPADSTQCRPVVTKDMMLVHLSHAILSLLDHWIDKVQQSSDERVWLDFTATWQNAAQALLTRMSEDVLKLQEVELQQELSSTMEEARKLCSTGVPPRERPAPLPPPAEPPAR